MSRRPYEFDNFVIADGSAAVLDLAVNRRSFRRRKNVVGGNGGSFGKRPGAAGFAAGREEK